MLLANCVGATAARLPVIVIVMIGGRDRTPCHY